MTRIARIEGAGVECTSIEGAGQLPFGPGLRLVQLRVRPSEVVVLGGILAGYDGIASIHGDETGMVVLLATDGTIDELNEIMLELARSVAFERIAETPLLEPVAFDDA